MIKDNKDNSKPVSIAPSSFVDDSPSEKIAQMTLTRFLSSTGKKLIENSTPDQWVKTSVRSRIPGLLSRYESFARSQDTSPFAIFRVQELHWLSHCQVNDTLTRALHLYNKTHDLFAGTEYIDLPQYCGDTPDLLLGKPSLLPLNINHHSAIAAEIMSFVRAVELDFSSFTDIGRGWSLTTVQKSGTSGGGKYDDWAKRIFWPIYEKLMERAAALFAAREEAMVILTHRQKLRKNGKKGLLM